LPSISTRPSRIASKTSPSSPTVTMVTPSPTDLAEWASLPATIGRPSLVAPLLAQKFARPKMNLELKTSTASQPGILYMEWRKGW